MNAGASGPARRVRAPREHEGTLIEPPLADVPALLSHNGSLQDDSRCQIYGRPLPQLATAARAELLQAAADTTQQYRDLPTLPCDGPMLLAGHQPQLFHAGVWFKNFVLSGLASRHRGVGINLVIDSDTLRSPAIRVPGGTLEQPTAHAVAFDAPGPQIPFEERALLDREQFASFGQRAAEELAPFISDPLLQEYWPLVLKRSCESSNLGFCLAQARHELEGHWGAVTLELPQSRVCQLPSFYLFAVHLIAELPRLRAVYNRSLAEYRQIHGVRSKNHPAPELAEEGDALEAPFWMWSQSDPRRRRVFVRRQRDTLLLFDRAGTEIALPCTDGGDPQKAIETLAALPQRGIKLRTRALITTLWARLALSDLFLHGIGGAKYDQLTDLILARFFHVPAPAFLTVTATLRLPIEHPHTTVDDVLRIDQQLRDLQFHPERWLRNNLEQLPAAQQAEAQRQIQQKAHWIELAQTPDNARSRCRAIRNANAALSQWTHLRDAQLRRERERLSRQQRAAALLGSREYAFCLFPEKTLRDFYWNFLRQNRTLGPT